MNWRERIQAELTSNVQKLHSAQTAMRELEAALRTLGSLGFPLHVEDGPEKVETWPKMVFHLRLGGREVACQAELDELGPDWFPSMDAARQSAGMTKQMQRGGIFDKAIPARLEDNVDWAGRIAMREEEKAAVKAFAEETRERNRQNGWQGISMPGTSVSSNNLES